MSNVRKGAEKKASNSTEKGLKESQEFFMFSAENKQQAHQIIAKYPEGRQASAILSLLHMAQKQGGGWLSPSALEYIANFLDMPKIKVYEVASFYTMFNLKPVGKYLVQICGTTPCYLCGAADLKKAFCEHLGIKEGETTKDGLFTLMEVECLGSCANAPMVQINDDYYEDLTEESFINILDKLAKGEAVRPGSQIGRQSSEPVGN